MCNWKQVTFTGTTKSLHPRSSGTKTMSFQYNNNNYYEINYETAFGVRNVKVFYSLGLFSLRGWLWFLTCLERRMEKEEKKLFSSHLWLALLLRILRFPLPLTLWHTTREFLHVLPSCHVVVMIMNAIGEILVGRVVFIVSHLVPLRS